MFNASTYKLKLIEAINKLGKTNGHKYPESPNDAIDAALVEFVIAKQLQDTAKPRYEAARAQLAKLCKLTAIPPGQNGVAHNSRIGVVQYNTLENPTKLDTTKLLNEMVKEFEITIDEAQALIDKCKTRTPGGQVRISASLNNLE